MEFVMTKKVMKISGLCKISDKFSEMVLFFGLPSPIIQKQFMHQQMF